MANYLVIHVPSNLVVKVIAASSQPKSVADLRFIGVSDRQLDAYYKIKSRFAPLMVDLGALLKISPSLLEAYTGKDWEGFQEGVTSHKLANEYPSRLRQRRAKLRKAA